MSKRDKKISKEELDKYSRELKPAMEKTVTNLGFVLAELSFVSEHNTNYLRLTISHPDHSVFVDECELVSKEVEKELDLKNYIPFPYILEVQSPGPNQENKEGKTHEFVIENLGLTVKV